MAVTEGDRGATIHTAEWAVGIGGFAVEVVDTVGCGDAFMASLLAGLLARDLDRLDRAAVREIGAHASAAGAVLATRAGAMARMPTPEEIDRLIAGHRMEAT